MICPRCSNELQDGSAFCTSCGLPLKDVMPSAPIPEDMPYVAPVEADDVYFPEFSSESQHPFAQPAAPQVPPVTVEKQKRSIVGLVLPIVLGVLLLAAVAFGVLMFIKAGNAAEELAATERRLENVRDELADAQAQAEEDAEYYADMEEYYYAFDEIASFAEYSNCGYASDKFHVDQGIIILRPDDTSKSLTLTGKYNGVTVSFEAYGYGADAYFTEGEWYGDTTNICVERDDSYLEEGEIAITTLTFTNDVDYDTFDVLIIVIG